MGLSNFGCAADGVFPVLAMNTFLSVAVLKNMVRNVMQVMGGAASYGGVRASYYYYGEDEDSSLDYERDNSSGDDARRRVYITKFDSLCGNNNSHSFWSSAERCCVCLCGFEAYEEVSQLSCKHFFHKDCLEKWFDNHQSTCPLCRSTI